MLHEQVLFYEHYKAGKSGVVDFTLDSLISKHLSFLSLGFYEPLLQNNKRGKEVSPENIQSEMRKKESDKTETRKIHIFLLVNVRSFGRYLLYVSICVLVFRFFNQIYKI